MSFENKRKTPFMFLLNNSGPFISMWIEGGWVFVGSVIKAKSVILVR